MSNVIDFNYFSIAQKAFLCVNFLFLKLVFNPCAGEVREAEWGCCRLCEAEGAGGWTQAWQAQGGSAAKDGRGQVQGDRAREVHVDAAAEWAEKLVVTGDPAPSGR